MNNMMTIEGVNQAKADIESGDFSLNTAELMVTALKTMLAQIAELDTTQKQTLQNYELEIAHWKRIAEDVQIRASVATLPSVMCSENHVQNCHCCDRMDCGDNTSEAKKRIAELEAAQQWHDASEPPERKDNDIMSRRVLIQEKSGDCFTDWYCYKNNAWFFSKRIVRWRDLPPMPEMDHDNDR